MFFAVPCEPYNVDPVAAQALDLLFILHADHEQNASTSTVRLAGSTGANPYAAISAGVSALWGPAHGGANEAVLAMLEQIGTVDHIPKYLAMAKDKSSHFRLMGFGHRVYKNFDPRAKIIRDMCHKVLAKLGRKDNPLFELALRLEEIALKDEYFVARKLYPNVDFYSGHHLQRARHSALDVHRDVRDRAHRRLGRALAGDDLRSAMRIGRPRQLYTGGGAPRLRADCAAQGGRGYRRRRSREGAAGGIDKGGVNPSRTACLRRDPCYTGLTSAVDSLPASYYFDPAHHQRELTRLCTAPDLTPPARRISGAGRFGDQSILVVRGEDGIARAFHNTCRHRGCAVPLVGPDDFPPRESCAPITAGATACAASCCRRPPPSTAMASTCASSICTHCR